MATMRSSFLNSFLLCLSCSIQLTYAVWHLQFTILHHVKAALADKGKWRCRPLVIALWKSKSNGKCTLVGQCSWSQVTHPFSRTKGARQRGKETEREGALLAVFNWKLHFEALAGLLCTFVVEFSIWMAMQDLWHTQTQRCTHTYTHTCTQKLTRI